MKYPIIVLVALLLYSCNSEMKDRRHLESLQNAPKAEKYEIGVACMRYISQHGNDIEYSKTLVRKLLAKGFFAEAIYAVEMLQKKFPQDPELFYLRGLGYRNQHQYSLAMDNFESALKIQPGNTIFPDEVRSMMEEQKVWDEILGMNESLTHTADSSGILLTRAEHFFSIRQYDAVLYDLGTLSNMGSTEDSLYFSRTVASLYQKEGKKSVEILTDMMKYFRVKTNKP